jgi:hypothetical protein
MIYAGENIEKIDHLIAAVNERGEELGRANGL